MVFRSFAAIGEHHGDLCIWAETITYRVLSDRVIEPSCVS